MTSTTTQEKPYLNLFKVPDFVYTTLLVPTKALPKGEYVNEGRINDIPDNRSRISPGSVFSIRELQLSCKGGTMRGVSPMITRLPSNDEAGSILTHRSFRAGESLESYISGIVDGRSFRYQDLGSIWHDVWSFGTEADIITLKKCISNYFSLETVDKVSFSVPLLNLYMETKVLPSALGSDVSDNSDLNLSTSNVTDLLCAVSGWQSDNDKPGQYREGFVNLKTYLEDTYKDRVTISIR